MVVHASNFEGLDFKSARDASHVGPKPPLNIWRDDLAPLLGREDAMVERGTIGVRHTPPSYSRFSPRAPEIPSVRRRGGWVQCTCVSRVSPWAILLSSLREEATAIRSSIASVVQIGRLMATGVSHNLTFLRRIFRLRRFCLTEYNLSVIFAGCGANLSLSMRAQSKRNWMNCHPRMPRSWWR